MNKIHHWFDKNGFNALRLSVAIGIAFAISTLIIFLVSDAPGAALGALLTGPLGSKRHFFNVLEMATPLAFTGFALSLIYQSGNFSMIADGSLYLGAVVASVIAIKLPLPVGIHPVVAIAASAVVGGLVGAIPALLKVKYKSNELVTSLMLNYVCFYSGLYVVNRFIIDRQAGNFASLKYEKTALLGKLMPGTRLHYGFLLMLIVGVLLYLFIYKTKWGYEIRFVGSNLEFAKHTGINTAKVIIMTQMLAGAIAGIGGASEKLGMYTRFGWADAPTYAWDGVIIAILAGNNPKYVPIAAFFLAYIRVGADIMSRTSDVQNELIAIIQGVIILLITAERFLYVVKQRQESKKALENYSA